MKKGVILIVDDNADCRELLMWFLQQHGFETISAKSGREAVELAIKGRPGLVLMDLNMPGIDGYEATRAIHADRHTKGIPVVALSADCADYGFERWAFEACFIAFVAKPWNPEALLEIVTNLLIGHDESTRAA
jgi:two-component system OmpR family response regulator